MVEEKAKKHGRSVALSGFIGFVLAAFVIGMVLGGYLTISIIVPNVQGMQQGNNYQGTSGNQNNYNSATSPTPTSNSYNTPGPNSNNYQYNNPNPQNQTSNNNQNNNAPQGVTNSNPAPTNPTGQYSATNCPLNLILQQNNTQFTGQIQATLNCVVQQNANNIILALTVTPTTIPPNLNQIVDTSSVTFNFAGTINNSQINANAAGQTGPGTGATFSLNLSGSFSSNKLMINISGAPGSEISVSTPTLITLQ